MHYSVTRSMKNNLDKPAPDIAAGAMKTLEQPSEAKYPEASKELCTHVLC